MKNFKLLKSYWPVFIVILIGSYWRLAGILAGTFGFTHDQGRDLLAAWAVVHDKLTLIGPTTGLAGVFHGPLWYWLLSIFSFLAGGNPKLILSFIVILYGAVELWLFWVINKFYRKFAALVLLGLISFSPFFIAINGQLWSPSMTTLSTMVALGALAGIVNGKKWWWLLGLALGVNIQFEAAGGVFLLASWVLAMIFVLKPLARFRDYIFGLVALASTFIPQVVFELRHGFLMTGQILKYIGQQQTDLIAEYGVKTVEYKTGLFFDNFNKLFFNQNVVLNLLLIFILFVLCARMIGFLVGKKLVLGKISKVLLWSVATIFFMWLLVNLYRDVVWHHFLLGISVIYMIIVTFLLEGFRKYLPKTVFILTVTIFAGLLIPLFRNFPLKQDFEGNHSVYRNQLKIIDEIYKDAASQPFNVVVYEPTTFSYSWDYQFSWYGNKTYGKLPVSNEVKQSLVYYIIEPDSIEGRRGKWLKERDGDGEIIWTREYWSDNGIENDGFLLQKRIR